MIPQDKVMHALVGAAVGAILTPVSPILALSVVAIIAGGKEACDAYLNLKAAKAGLPPPHGVELNDWLATVAGGVVGIAAHWAVVQITA